MLRVLLCSVIFLLAGSIGYGQVEFPELLPHQVLTIKWSLQGDKYATSHVDGSVRVYDAAGLQITIPDAHDGLIYGLSFDPSGDRLATGGLDDDLRVWDLRTGEMLAEFSNAGYALVSVAWKPDSSQIWTFTVPGETSVISVDISTDTYSLLQTVNLALSDDVAWKPDGSIIAIAARSINILTVDQSTFSVVRSLDATPDNNFFEPDNEFPISIAWHPTENIVADGKVNGYVHVWTLDSASDTVPLLTLEANEGVTDHALIPFAYGVEDIIFSADGMRLSSISADGTLRVWSVPEGELLHDINLGEAILSAAFSPDGTRLVYNTYTTEDTPLVFVEIDELITEP